MGRMAEGGRAFTPCTQLTRCDLGVVHSFWDRNRAFSGDCCCGGRVEMGGGGIVSGFVEVWFTIVTDL